MGWFGIGWIVDLVMIACGNFKDKQGRYLKTEGWKQLLDEGAITQEQFDAKRDELLNR